MRAGGKGRENPMIRSIAALALALAPFLAGLAAPAPARAAHHEPVLQAYLVDVKPGKLDQYRGEVKKLAGVMKRVGSPAVVRMWRRTAAGPETGGVLVGVEYPNAAAWAASQPKLEADAEWKRIMSGLPAIRTLESYAIWRDISTVPPSGGSGSVLVVTGVRVKPGRLEDYRKRVGGAATISKRLGLSGSMRMWHADLAGTLTGAVAVGVQHPDLAGYVADQAKLAGDAEWQKLLSGLTEMRTIVGRTMYVEITP
jgi:uncharacterized protein YbaA (DUF1428 family)